MANYIVCLAHFCEVHGPSTIICTQNTTEGDLSHHVLPSTAKLQTCASCKLVLPNDGTNIVSRMGSSGDENDDRLVFISTHYPALQKRYTSLMKLVIKSLSVETTLDLSKPVFYGDVVNGYCINKIFKIRDANARGGERKYSIMVVCDSEKELLLNWDNVTQYVSEEIKLIQTRVELVITQAMARKLDQDQATDNERFLRRSMNKPRSLVELTDDDQIFVKFHLWAMELLQDILSRSSTAM